MDKKIETLVRLGLTNNQARVYLSALQTGKASVKTIAQSAKIGREDVYRIMPSLLGLGLIKKHISSPALYEPVEPAEVISILISNKLDEVSETRKMALQFASEWRNSQKTAEAAQKDELFMMVTNVNLAIHTLIDAIRAANRSWVFTNSYDGFVFRLNMPKKRVQVGEMYKAARRGVKIRAILGNPKDESRLRESSFLLSSAKSLVRHKNFEYRYIPSSPDCLLSIFDDKLTFIETEQGPHVITPQLWSNNRVLLSLGRSYFEMLWNSAHPPIP